MTNAELSQQGRKLLDNLRSIFAGNHVHKEGIQPTREQLEQYRAAAYVIWRFEHEVTTTTAKGNASVSGAHFGYNTSDFHNRVRQLCERAVRNRDIRGPFMQRIVAARSDALHLSTEAQVVHDFGSYSVFRQCGSCRGSGRVSCGGCAGSGRRTCFGCGGMGWHNRTVTHTRWNGRHNETYSKTVRETCHSCGGGGRVVCTSCGGSGKQTCGACAGNGYFTDISRVRALARPWWNVPEHSGLGAGALVRALERGGPRRARALVPFDLAGTDYNESDNWVARYEGIAEVVELGIEVINKSYSVVAVGTRPTPITTPLTCPGIFGPVET
ncbi:Uncharacterised protein [Burkholderia pseudomallei]|nr:Uncharacterised protein [Burkholderia pseudomallei]CAJ3866634.1 Uncharacterised protein [Burkholderia pseudomallei]CAJ3896704.1 Uncharacterised protein [Burkholderia pseudomallei]CAJ5632343.1 Uncharacterised protein [Burkholderia pseudomallei]CAJ7002104.1 Uncharacterised protein [Burkholderia pseudomallei]